MSNLDVIGFVGFKPNALNASFSTKSNILQGHNKLELMAKVTQESDAKGNF